MEVVNAVNRSRCKTSEPNSTLITSTPVHQKCWIHNPTKKKQKQHIIWHNSSAHTDTPHGDKHAGSDIAAATTIGLRLTHRGEDSTTVTWSWANSGVNRAVLRPGQGTEPGLRWLEQQLVLDNHHCNHHGTPHAHHDPYHGHGHGYWGYSTSHLQLASRIRWCSGTSGRQEQGKQETDIAVSKTTATLMIRLKV